MGSVRLQVAPHRAAPERKGVAVLHSLRQDPGRRDLVLLLALTFTTGIVDAVGYLSLDLTFTGNMTGNVLILGMGVAGAPDLPVGGPLLALAAFWCGALLGGRLLRRAAPSWSGRTSACVLATGVTVAATGMLLLVRSASDVAVRSVAVGLLSAAMGLQAAVARRLGVADVTTVVVTSVLTRFASDIGAGTPHRWPRRLAVVALIGAGALVGAVLVRAHIALALGVAAVLVVSAAVIGELTTRPGPRSPAQAPAGLR